MTAVVLLAVPLAACDPLPPPAPGTADVQLRIGADGGADLQVQAPGDVRAFAEAAGEALLPAAPRRTEVLDTPSGPVAYVHFRDVYRPGRDVVVDIDAAGLRQPASFRVCVPATVAATFEADPPPDSGDSVCRNWSAAAPRVRVELRPDARRWWGAMALLLAEIALLAAALVAVVRRRRRAALGLAAVIVAAACGSARLAAAAQAANLGVAGTLSGAALTTAYVIGYLPLLLAPAAIAAAVVATVRRDRGAIGSGA